MIATPFFSVVIPVYNKEPHVHRALLSVLNQSFQDFELVAVCDPSSDNSEVEVYRVKDDRMKVLKRDKPGPGGYAARNEGIKHSAAEWVVFLDADDEWYPNHLENFKKCIEENPGEEFFASGYDIVDIDSRLNRRVSIETHGQSRRINFLEYLKVSPFFTSVVCLRKSLIVSSGLFPEGKMNRGGDVDTWLRCIYQAGGYVWSNHVGAVYYRDTVNMVTRVNFYSESEIVNTSVLSLIEKERVGKVASALRLRYNDLVIYAWNQNVHLGVKKNIKIRGRLFFKPLTLKAILYSVFSEVPYPALKTIHRFSFRLVSIKRNGFQSFFSRSK
ncbi:glycosyltransferase family 2 protein [Halomonas salifodinae]|uniref:glycosyltransferase family 2 protein n=1 Tax=Halomonas salifodinae TaxID=438745 RepID=UPI0033B31722